MDNTHQPIAGAGARGRALFVGATAADAERAADHLDPQAQVICLASDRESGDAVRRTLAARRPGARIVVMLGDPALLVHKVAGPFDIIVDGVETRQRRPGHPSRHEYLRSLLTDGGELYGRSSR